MGKPREVVLDIKLRDIVMDGWTEFMAAIGLDRPDTSVVQVREMMKSFLAGMSFMFGVLTRISADCAEKELGEDAQAAIVQSIVARIKQLANQLATDQIAEMMEQVGQGSKKPN